MNSTHDTYGIFTAVELYLEVIQNARVGNEPQRQASTCPRSHREQAAWGPGLLFPSPLAPEVLSLARLKTL